MHDVRTVTESGMFALVFRSRKPEAIRFRHWVTEVVLPALRRTGHYEMDGPPIRQTKNDLRDLDWPEKRLEVETCLRVNGRGAAQKLRSAVD